MSEAKFKVGDTVVLNEVGRRVVKNIDLDTVFTITSLSKDFVACSCSFNKGLNNIYLYCSNIEQYQTFTNPMQTTKEQMFELLTKQMFETFKKKNADYGDSTSNTFKEFGLTSYAIRLNDKLNRIKSFCKKGDLEVKDERIVDTLLDMANYCLLAVIDIKEKEDGKED